MIREWDIKRTTFSLGDFYSWQKAGSLELSPSFQRRSVWTKPQKSYFIDTVYRGLPVPIIFLRERTDVETLSTLREVIDGQQRLRTVLSFIDLKCIPDASANDEFLVNKKHNADLANKSFSALSQNEKTRILSYQLSVHVLPSDTSDPEVLSIFARMNSTGSKLNDQELRNAEYFGEFKLVSYDLAHSNLSRWRSWKVFTEQEIARMKEVEFTSSLLITLIDGLFERTQSNIDKYYERYDDSLDKAKGIAKRFVEVMDLIESSFGDSLSTSNFSNSSQFLQLFHLVGRLEAAGVPLSRGRVRTIIALGEQIKLRKDLPEAVGLALASRFNRLSNQKTVSDYLFKHASE